MNIKKLNKKIFTFFFILLATITLGNTNIIKANGNKDENIEVRYQYQYLEEGHAKDMSLKKEELLKQNPNMQFFEDNKTIEVTKKLEAIQIYYQKLDTCPVIPPNPSVNTPPNPVNTLPKAGNQIEGLYITYGLVAIVASILLYRKSKANIYVIVLMLFVSSMVLNTQQLEAKLIVPNKDNTQIIFEKEDETKTHKAGETIDLNTQIIKLNDGTCLVPFIAIKTINPKISVNPKVTTGTIIVRHFDHLGNKLKNDEVIAKDVPIGTSVTLPSSITFTKENFGTFADGTVAEKITEQDREWLLNVVLDNFNREIKLLNDIINDEFKFDNASGVLKTPDNKNFLGFFYYNIDEYKKLMEKYSLPKIINEQQRYISLREFKDEAQAKEFIKELKDLARKQKDELVALKEKNNHIPTHWDLDNVYKYPGTNNVWFTKTQFYKNKPDKFIINKDFIGSMKGYYNEAISLSISELIDDYNFSYSDVIGTFTGIQSSITVYDRTSENMLFVSKKENMTLIPEKTTSIVVEEDGIKYIDYFYQFHSYIMEDEILDL